jgi:hypothetical protein
MEREVMALALDFGAEYETATPLTVISRTVKNMTEYFICFIFR